MKERKKASIIEISAALLQLEFSERAFFFLIRKEKPVSLLK